MLRQVLGAGGSVRRRRASLLTLLAAVLPAGVAAAAGSVRFDGSPGTKVPPARLDGVRMTKFGTDHRPNHSYVTRVAGPTGTLEFDRQVLHFIVGPKKGQWMSWSNHYHGSVYAVYPTVTLELPPRTDAFYFYAEPNDSVPGHRSFSVTASTAGATSGPLSVRSTGGAKFFGFVATGGETLSSITVRSTDRQIPGKKKGTYKQYGGFAIGEFGIHKG
jgi:hypothetical protein